jgi:hypothetical protein
MDIQVFRPPRFNSNNHEERRPFVVVDGVTRVDTKSSWLLDMFPDAIITDMVHPLTPMNPQEVAMYTKIVRSYSLTPETWGRLHWAADQLQIVPIAHTDDLLDLINIRAATGRDLRTSDLEPWDDIREHVNAILDEYSLGAFVKLSQKSPKKGFNKMVPCKTFYEVMDLITSSAELSKYLDRKEYLILAPWMEFDRRNEYRVFVINHTIKAISQQNCYNEYGVRDVSEQMKSIIKWYDSIEFPYDCATIDVVVSANECCLIEINPPGDWGSSGSALFHWIDDNDIFYNDNQTIAVRIF